MLRVGLIGPCIGVGGGDALMLGLVQYCHNVEFTGIAFGNHAEIKHYDWAWKACGNNLPPLHTKDIIPDQHIKNINYHASHAQAIHAAIKDCDIAMTWCVHSFDRNIPVSLDIPIIEYIQNSDDYARSVVNTNLGIPSFYGACSETAAKVAPRGKDCKIIYNGIDPGRVTPRIGREAQREYWNLTDKKILLFMGRFVKEKHPEILLSTLQHLPDEWVVVFVGAGYQDTQLYTTAQTFFPDRVFFAESQYHVGDILAAADVFMLPSDFEGHSLALTEAWFAGTPTVSSEHDSLLELESKFGPLSIKIPKVSNGETAAEAVLKAASSDGEVIANIANARSVVWHNFTMSTIAAQWEEFFDYCLYVWRRKKRNGKIYPVLPMKPSIEAK